MIKNWHITFFITVLLLSNGLYAENLANPAVLLQPARIALGASYDLGGYTITNRDVPCMLNRVQGRCSYSPNSYVNFGIDAGTVQMEIASDTTATDTFDVFHGKYGITGGAHLKLGTPFYFNNLVCGVCIIDGSYFSSKNDAGTTYSGMDGAAGLGLQFHLNGFGFLTAGSTVYLIKGKDQSYSGAENFYSNKNNVRGWLALDYFPSDKMGSNNTLYISLELSVSPKVTFNDRAPVQEFGFSVAIGSISRRLYGQDASVEWKP